MTGFEMVQGLMSGTRPPCPMLRLIPARVHSCQEGIVELRAIVDPLAAYNDIGITHGGWSMTLLDTAMGLAAMTLLPEALTCASSDVAVRFLRGVRIEDGEMRIIGSVASQGRRLIVTEGRIESASGRIHCLSSASFVTSDKTELANRYPSAPGR